jgi:hypothetical protein
VGPYAELLKLAKKENWQQCPVCRSMVERTYGCNFMVRRQPTAAHEQLPIGLLQWAHVRGSEVSSHWSIAAVLLKCMSQRIYPPIHAASSQVCTYRGCRTRFCYQCGKQYCSNDHFSCCNPATGAACIAALLAV